MNGVKSSLLSAETWLGAGGAVMVYDAPSGMHAMAVGIILAAFVLGRSWVKASAGGGE
jgi:hypothetical protein